MHDTLALCNRTDACWRWIQMRSAVQIAQVPNTGPLPLFERAAAHLMKRDLGIEAVALVVLFLADARREI